MLRWGLNLRCLLCMLLASPTIAEPVTYVFSAQSVTNGPSCSDDAPNTVTGTITIDFANENPRQSSGNVGSPTGWTSVSTAKTQFLSVPYVFTMAVCGFGPYLSVVTSSVTVGPNGISGKFALEQAQSGNITFSNPSGNVSANGLPLFDSPGMGSGVLGLGAEGIPFIITSMTLVPPTVTQQLDGLITESTGNPGFVNIANNAQAHVQQSCISLENFVLQAKTREANNQLTPQRANQLIFDALTAELEIGC